MADTSKGPAITSANLPRPVPAAPATPAVTPLAQLPQEVQQAAAAAANAVFDDRDVVVAPLVTPDFVHIKPKSPNVSFRWILHTLFMKDGGQSSLRFEQAKSQGFMVATAADIVNPPMAYVRDGGSKFINGDLILMKIDRRKYEGALQYKEQQAVRQMLAVNGKPGQTTVVKEVSTQQHRAGKISVFNPTQDELKEFVGDDDDTDVQASNLTR